MTDLIKATPSSFGEYKANINEVLITLGNKAYPKFGNIVILAGGAGCHTKDTEVLMYDGNYKKVQDIKLNDLLMGTDSTPRTVSELHTGQEKMLKVSTNKGDTYTSNINHMHSFYCNMSKCGFKNGEVYDLTYAEWLETKPSVQKSLKMFKSKALEFRDDKYEFDIDPWIIGFWLGDELGDELGDIAPNFNIKNNSPIIKHISEKYNGIYLFNELKTDKVGYKTYSLISKKRGNPFLNYLRDKCFDGEKRIPRELLTSSIMNRKAVLAGLIDSADHANGYYNIIVKFDGLKEDIEFLCGSLGYRTTTKIKKVKRNGEYRYCHNINISGEFDNLPVVLEYKQIKNSNKKLKNNPLNMGFKFEELGEDTYYGFSIKEDDKHFILKNFMVNHNSGKGYIQENLLGIEGKVLDVDALKKLAMNAPGIIAKVKKEYKKDISVFNLKRPDDVFALHDIIKGMGLADKKMANLATSILAGDPDRKPNIIFDVTLNDFAKFKKLTQQASKLGYKKENIHIVWVVNDIRVAMNQNRTRSRIVPEEILIDTHKGAHTTMDKIIKLSKDITQYMNGAIVFAFNKQGADSTVSISKKSNVEDIKKRLKKAEDEGDFNAISSISTELDDFQAVYKNQGIRQGSGGFYVVDAKYTVIKEKGKNIDTKQLSKKLDTKLKDYTPNEKEFPTPSKDK